MGHPPKTVFQLVINHYILILRETCLQLSSNIQSSIRMFIHLKPTIPEKIKLRPMFTN